MKIPQNEPDISIRTGPTGPQSQPSDFGPDTSGLGQGLMHLAHGLGEMSRASIDVAERQRERDENRWLGESYEQEKAVLNEWMADPENHSKESFATDFRDFAKARVAEYDGVAPSADARDAFRNNIGSFIGRKYEEAIQTSEKTKIQNTVLSFDDQTANALMGYRQAQGVPGSNPNEDLQDSFDSIRLGIHSQFYNTAPVLAGKLQDKAVKDFVLATAESDPKLARHFLDISPDLDEHLRQTLIKHIEQQEKVVDLIGRDSFDRYRQDTMVGIENGKSRDKIPLTLYQQYYPGDHAVVQKNRDDALIDTTLKSRDTLDRLAPLEGSRQMNELVKMRAGISTKEDADVFKYVAKQVFDNIELQEKNRVAWLQQNNPEVRSLSQQAASSPESLRVQAITERNNAILKYQGPAPTIDPSKFDTKLSADQEKEFQTWKAKYAPNDSGYDYDLRGAFLAGLTPNENAHWPDTFKKPNHPTFSNESKFAKDFPEMAGRWDGETFIPPPPDTSSWYLDKPSNDRHLMTTDEAEQEAVAINRASPAEAVATINKVLAKYPDPAHQYIAFSDMVTIPSEGKRLKQEYQLAFQNKDAWWLDSYVGAIANSGSIAKLTEEKRKDLVDQIDKLPTWQSFQRAMIGDNFSRSKEVEGYKNGIIMYAESLVANGRSIKDATKSATDMLLGETMGFTSINNQPLALLKERSRKDLPRRSDDEIQDIGRKLTMSLKDLDPRDVDRTNFPVLEKMGPADSVAKMQVLRDLVTSKGFFQTTGDGQGALLYMQDDNGNIFQVRDKEKNPFVIYFDELPNYYTPSVLGPTFNKPAQPQKTYDLEETSGNFLGLGDLFGTKHSKTNWPTTPNFMKRSHYVAPPDNQLQK